MTFDEFIKNAWRNHGTKTQEVASSLASSLELIEKSEQIPVAAKLFVHVMGEHLGEFSAGIELLEELKDLPVFRKGSDADVAVKRSIAILRVAGGNEDVITGFSPSDQVHILVMAAAALVERRELDRAYEYFIQAEQLIADVADKSDSVFRVMAASSNNIAVSLEEIEDQTIVDSDFMKKAAWSARKYWQVAGGWLEVERAEYRLSCAYRKAKDPRPALDHARLCLEICEKNNAPALEFFFAYEVIAKAANQLENDALLNEAVSKAQTYYGQLSENEKPWCEDTLLQLESLR